MKGITLLVAVILTSVVLSVALALLNISYKQILLSSTARQSQYAIYSADSTMECALYWDQRKAAFSYTLSPELANIVCNGIVITPVSTSVTGSTRKTTFTVPCVSGGVKSGEQGVVTAYKTSTGQTTIFATGYSTCTATDPRRIERGLTVTYGT